MTERIRCQLLTSVQVGCQGFARNAERFRIFENEPWYSRGLRQMSVDKFLVFYIPNAEDETVTVIRIMYGRRDIDKQLKKNN